MAATIEPKGLFYDLKQEVGVPEDIRLTETLTLTFPSREGIKQYRVASSAEERNRAIFGKHYDAIQELFDTEPPQLYLAFIDRVEQLWFGKGANDVEGK